MSRGGSTSAWRRVRAAVLARDGYRCRLQTHPRCEGVANTVHHLQSPLLGDDPATLIAACGRCNYSYGDPTDPKHGDPQPQVRTKW